MWAMNIRTNPKACSDTTPCRGSLWSMLNRVDAGAGIENGRICHRIRLMDTQRDDDV